MRVPSIIELHATDEQPQPSPEEPSEFDALGLSTKDSGGHAIFFAIFPFLFFSL